MNTSLRKINYFCWNNIGHLWLLFVLKPICEICRWCAEKVLFSVLEEGEISLDVSREFWFKANACLEILLDFNI